MQHATVVNTDDVWILVCIATPAANMKPVANAADTPVRKTPMRSLGLHRTRVQTTFTPSTGAVANAPDDCNTPASVPLNQPTASQTAERQTSGIPSVQQPHCQSTGGIVRRRCRLSLNRHIETKNTRKRLNFVSSTASNARSDATDSDQPQPEDDDGGDGDIEQLRQLVATETARLASCQAEDAEHRKLRASIAQWEDGFRRAFSELQSLTVEPHNTPEALLQLLNIPPDLITLE